MASGDTLAIFTPAQNVNIVDATPLASLDLRNGHLVLDFDAATDEQAAFAGVLSRAYSGGGITVRVFWSAATATSGNAVIYAYVERLADEGQDTDSDGFAGIQAVTAAAPSTSGALQYSDITFTDGTQMDSLAAGEAFRLKILRDANHASDTMAGDLELHRVEIRET